MYTLYSFTDAVFSAIYFLFAFKLNLLYNVPVTTTLYPLPLYMEITQNNPWSYKTARMSAMPINIAWIVCTLALFGLTMVWVQMADASNHTYCDKQFESLFFQEVPASIQKECKNRFIYNTNKIKAEMRRIERLHSNF
mgnify:CR=1 FL=1